MTVSPDHHLSTSSVLLIYSVFVYFQLVSHHELFEEEVKDEEAADDDKEEVSEAALPH